MPRNTITSEIIDAVMTSAIRTGSLAPDVIGSEITHLLERPASDYLAAMEPDARELELRRIITYVLRQQLIAAEADGVVLLSGGKRRLYKREFETNRIPTPDSWDGSWRMVLFDIPSDNNVARSSFTRQLRRLGMQPLQQSVWIYPYACREQIMLVADSHGIGGYITYIETRHVDNDKDLQSMFAHLLI